MKQNPIPFSAGGNFKRKSQPQRHWGCLLTAAQALLSLYNCQVIIYLFDAVWCHGSHLLSLSSYTLSPGLGMKTELSYQGLMASQLSLELKSQLHLIRLVLWSIPHCAWLWGDATRGEFGHIKGPSSGYKIGSIRWANTCLQAPGTVGGAYGDRITLLSQVNFIIISSKCHNGSLRLFNR